MYYLSLTVAVTVYKDIELTETEISLLNGITLHDSNIGKPGCHLSSEIPTRVCLLCCLEASGHKGGYWGPKKHKMTKMSISQVPGYPSGSGRYISLFFASLSLSLSAVSGLCCWDLFWGCVYDNEVVWIKLSLFLERESIRERERECMRDRERTVFVCVCVRETECVCRFPSPLFMVLSKNMISFSVFIDKCHVITSPFETSDDVWYNLSF